MLVNINDTSLDELWGREFFLDNGSDHTFMFIKNYNDKIDLLDTTTNTVIRLDWLLDHQYIFDFYTDEDNEDNDDFRGIWLIV